MQKHRKTHSFSTFSAKYCKNSGFQMVFEHIGCKNNGKPLVFQHFQQNIVKTTGFIGSLSTLDAKTMETLWFFNIFLQNSYDPRKSKDCIAKIA